MPLRQLACKQLTWYKKESRFKWINVTPQVVPDHDLATCVANWFTSGCAISDHWDGNDLKTLVKFLSLLSCVTIIYEHISQTKEEHSELYRYTPVLAIYNNPDEITATISDLEAHLSSMTL